MDEDQVVKQEELPTIEGVFAWEYDFTKNGKVYTLSFVFHMWEVYGAGCTGS